jgi:hypothetical protein
MADALKISVSTVKRIIKNIPEIEYEGRGCKGHWVIKEKQE